MPTPNFDLMTTALLSEKAKELINAGYEPTAVIDGLLFAAVNAALAHDRIEHLNTSLEEIVRFGEKAEVNAVAQRAVAK